MQMGSLFADAYLAEIINERDAARRRAAIHRLIHPDIRHMSFDRLVHGREAFELRVNELVAPMTPRMRVSLRGEPEAVDNTVFFRWQMSEDNPVPLAKGGAFVVLDEGMATWFYATATLTSPVDPSLPRADRGG